MQNSIRRLFSKFIIFINSTLSFNIFFHHSPFAVPMRERGDGLKSTLDEEQMTYIDQIAGACAQTLALQNAKVTSQKSSNLPPIR